MKQPKQDLPEGLADQPEPELVFLLRSALDAHRAGSLSQAELIYRDVLAANPQNADALHLMGVIAHQRGMHADAVEQISKAIEISPTTAVFHVSRGKALLALDRLNEALASYEEAIRFMPRDAGAHFHRGNALNGLKRFDDALVSYDQAVRLNPAFAEAHSNRGNVLRKLNRLDDALSSYDQAISLKPDFADAFFNRGIALTELKRLDDALASYDQALRYKPDFAQAYYNRGDALRDLRRLDDSLASYDQAVRLKPDYAAAFCNRGNVLKDLKRFEDALASYERVIQLDPDFDFFLGVVANTRARIGLWGGLEDLVRSISERIVMGRPTSPPFTLLALLDDPAIHLRAARKWANEKARSSEVLPPVIERQRGNKIHIAYISADFHDHATSYLMAELFELHDRNRFQLTAISFGPDKGKAIRDRISAAFDRFEDVRQMGDLDVARLCRELGVDIAVDLKGYTQDSRPGILAERCAPIQINWLGFPGSMAAPFIDYIVADRTLITDQDLEHYTEKVIWLPDAYQVNDGKRQIADKQFTRSECGLPARGFVFCCFNNNYKILPATFDVWMRILKRVPDSVLWLFEDNPIAAQNLRAEAASRGVDPDRLVFAKRMPIAEHLARHRLADLFIDTWPYNAHTTASDALWAGLPVLTQTGKSFASRVAASLLKAVGLPELITDNDHDYEELAVALAQDPLRLRRLKDKLAANRLTYPLFDCKRFTGYLEQAYQHVIQRYWAGLPPGHFDLPVADFGEIKQVTPALSGRQLAQGGKSAILLQKSASGATPKIAVITPYYRESLEVLRQAHESVLEQGLNVDHFLIADGFPRIEVSSWRAQHVILPRANHDNGNTPRGIGSALARSNGYDFIAYLDADNWYHSGHISSLLELHDESEASVICSLRTFHGTDGAPLRVSESDEDNHRHVDTSCFLLYRDCFDSIDIWLKMPKILGPLCDRIFLKALREKRYRFAYSDMRTVAFRSQYAVHYVAAGLEPPHEAKRDISADALAWVKSIQGVTECVNTLGFYPLPFG